MHPVTLEVGHSILAKQHISQAYLLFHSSVP